MGGHRRARQAWVGSVVSVAIRRGPSWSVVVLGGPCVVPVGSLWMCVGGVSTFAFDEHRAHRVRGQVALCAVEADEGVAREVLLRLAPQVEVLLRSLWAPRHMASDSSGAALVRPVILAALPVTSKKRV